MRRLLLALALVALWWTCRDTPPPGKHTGIVVYWGPQPDSVHWRMYWIDLADGTPHPLDYNHVGETISYNTDRTAAWLTFTGTKRHDGSGVLRVGRKGKKLATRYYENTSVRSVAPDEKRAVMTRTPPGSYVPLVFGTVKPDRFVPGDNTGVDTFNTNVLGWFPYGVAVRHVDVRGPALVTLIPGQSPRAERALEWAEEEHAMAHDGKTVAWVVQLAGSDRYVVRIDDLDDPYDDIEPREIELGDADMARCAYSPDDETLGCELAHEHNGIDYISETLAIDLATSKVTRFGRGVGPLVFSPDSKSLIVMGPTMTIVPVDGGPQVKLPFEGAPVVWIR